MWSYNCDPPSELYHYGVLGMKWGVRRYKNKDGSLTIKEQRRYGEEHNRVLAKGTEIQNISRRHLDSTNKKENRIYVSYTDSDKKEYMDMMGNFQYNERGYKNTFTVKKDIKIASEREIVKTVSEMFQENPQQMSKMLATAHNAVNMPLFFFKNEKGFNKKLTNLVTDPTSKKSLELGRQFVKTVPMTNKTKTLADDFYARMTKKGFDAVLDTNDGYSKHGATQDPLIIFNMEKLGEVTSVKLNKKDLDAIAKYVGSKDFRKNKKDTSNVTHSELT